MSAEPELPTLRRLPLHMIDPPSLDMRQGMDPEKLDELTRDIKLRGVRLPIEVLVRGDRFEIIAGHRRFCASEKAGRVEIPSLVYATRDDDLEADRYKENMLREDVEPAAEAIYLGRICDSRCGGDTDTLAAYVGRSRGHVERRLNLLYGDEDVFAALAAGKIGVMIAEELNRCDDPKEVKYYLHQVLTGGATRAIVRGWVDQWKERTKTPPHGAGVDGAENVGAPVLIDDYFTCVACKSTENKSRMRPVNVHDYCWLAWVEKLIAAYNRGEIRLP